MNLLCPLCQKMLTVPEEFAGQLMKCPLCSGNFTVPGLPDAAGHSSAAEPSETDIYSIRHDPAPPSPPPLPELEPSPPAMPAPANLTPSPALTPSRTPEDHQHTISARLSPKVLPWIAPVCLVLIFFQQFLDWDGLYPGGVPVATANAWYAAFGKYPVDPDLKELVPMMSDEKYKPGWSVLTFFYLMLFFPALLVTIASVVLPTLPLKLPPWVEKLMPWRWGIVAAANLFLFLFLGLQVLLGFSLDSSYQNWVDTMRKQEATDESKTHLKKQAEVRRGERLQMLRHTFALRLVVLLHLVAILGAVLMVWLERRGSNRPLPKLELRW